MLGKVSNFNKTNVIYTAGCHSFVGDLTAE